MVGHRPLPTPGRGQAFLAAVPIQGLIRHETPLAPFEQAQSRRKTPGSDLRTWPARFIVMLGQGEL